MELKSCPECGVPETITSEHQWLNNGDIVHTRAQTSRILFIETENLDPLFRNITQIIGTDIEHMVVTAARRAYRVYLSAFIPEEIGEKIRRKEMEYMSIVESFFYLASLNGTGRYFFVDMRYEQDDDDFNVVRISEPNCIPLAIAAHLGDIELQTGVDHGYTCEEVQPDLYEIRVFPSPHPKELSERLWFEPYNHRDGDLDLERCATCGGPKILAGYRWYPDRGVIASQTTGRRMAIQGSALLDPVFNELEVELGDTVPRAVVEAQRRFTRSGFYRMDDITDEGDFRTQLAFRGLGNLKKLEMKKKGMSMRVENVALPYIVAGLSQGFFEMGFRVDSTVDWELSEEGNLQVEVKPLAHQQDGRLKEQLLELKMCPECGVPELINSEYLWLNNGDIVHRRAQSSRMVVIETQNLDLLFRNIAQIIGSEIEHLVITAGRRACRIFLLHFVPGETREKIRNKEIDYELIDAMFRDVARANGIGDYRPVDKRYEQDEKDYCTVSIGEPHCLPMAVSAHVGAIECLTEVDQGYRYEEVSPDLYNITAFPSPHQEELSSRMWVKPFEHRDGDIEFERCGTCGGPKILSAYQWHAGRGIIVNNTTGRRISIQGEAQLSPVFQELEAELGDTIPRAVVEAQRRFTRSGFYTLDDVTDEGDFRTQLALRGLGNLKKLEMKKTGMNMHVENVAMPYIVIGLSQGFFEIGFGVDSTVDWELSEEGDLQVEVKPLSLS